jgi:hypothetical protein
MGTHLRNTIDKQLIPNRHIPPCPRIAADTNMQPIHEILCLSRTVITSASTRKLSIIDIHTLRVTNWEMKATSRI